jgi:predicted nucleic acid-binding protein
MRLLLDTNIIIHREASTVVNQDIGVLFNWIDKLGYQKCVHPTTLAEIQKHQDQKVVKTMSVKLSSYNQMQTEAPIGQHVKAVSDKVDKNENDWNDTKILNEVFCGRIDALITEDRKIHYKASLLNISDKVFTIDAFLEKVNSENPKLTDYKVLSVKKEYFGNIDINDPFFDSFKEDYVGFEKWFSKKSEEIAYICLDDKNNILAFLYIKIEGHDENYNDITPYFSKKKRLKIGTFKVIMNGFKLGERFLKIIFDNALINKVEEIYVTIFNKRIEQQRLIQLLSDWGFENFGEKSSSAGNEMVLCRDFSKQVNKISPKLTYPYIDKDTNFWIVPIYPAYHTELFPDSILRTESPNNFIESEPHRNAISKVYVSRSIERGLKAGDVVVFYRTAEPGKDAYYSSVVSTIGVIESVITNIKSEADFISLCRKRSVFTDAELKEHWNYKPSWRPFIVNFLYVYSFPKRPNRKDLIDLGIFAGNYAPRGFDKISRESFELIIKSSLTNDSFIVN